jgi:hypothetical protein
MAWIRAFVYLGLVVGLLCGVHYGDLEELKPVRQHMLYKDFAVPAFAYLEKDLWPQVEPFIDEYLPELTYDGNEAEILGFTGEVEFQAPSKMAFAPIELGQKVFKRSIVSTEKGGTTELKLKDGSKLFVDANSVVVLGLNEEGRDASARTSYVKVEKGGIHVSRPESAPGTLYLVTASGAQQQIIEGTDWVLIGSFGVVSKSPEANAHTGSLTPEYLAQGPRSFYKKIKSKLIADRKTELMAYQKKVERRALGVEEQRKAVAKGIPLTIPARGSRPQREAVARAPASSSKPVYRGKGTWRESKGWTQESSPTVASSGGSSGRSPASKSKPEKVDLDYPKRGSGRAPASVGGSAFDDGTRVSAESLMGRHLKNGECSQARTALQGLSRTHSGDQRFGEWSQGWSRKIAAECL